MNTYQKVVINYYVGGVNIQCCLLGRLQINQNLIQSNQIKVWVLVTKENEKKKFAPKQDTEQPKTFS